MSSVPGGSQRATLRALADSLNIEVGQIRQHVGTRSLQDLQRRFRATGLRIRIVQVAGEGHSARHTVGKVNPRAEAAAPGPESHRSITRPSRWPTRWCRRPATAPMLKPSTTSPRQAVGAHYAEHMTVRSASPTWRCRWKHLVMRAIGTCGWLPWRRRPLPPVDACARLAGRSFGGGGEVAHNTVAAYLDQMALASSVSLDHRRSP